MKWKISNTLFVVAGLIFILGIAFNYAQVKRSVESSLEKARRVKREKAKARKKAEKDIEEDQFFAENDIDTEFEEIINNNKTDGK